MTHLFRAASQTAVSMRKLLLLLRPNLSLEGSNRRREEDISYGLFINYLREVAGN